MLLYFQAGELSSQLASIRISGGKVVTEQAAAIDDPARQYAWEQGQIDYLGVDKFENIQKRLDQSLATPPPAASEEAAGTSTKKTISPFPK